VNDNDVPNDDMPNFLRPAPRDGLPFSDAALAALLAGTEPPEPTPGLEHVADLLAALRSAPSSDELAGEAGILAEFRRGTGGPVLSPGSRRPRRFTSRLGARAAVAAAVAALGLGGLATAAYAGMLPASVQRLAHDTIGAPAVPSGLPSRSHQTGKRTPAGPGAAGLTARRLCTAYTHGTAVQRAAARHDLIRAAGGAGKIAEYCGTATHPGRSGPHSGGKPVPPGQQGKGTPPGQQGKGTPPGQQKKSNGVPPGQQKGTNGASPAHQHGHDGSQSKGKSSAHGGSVRGKHGAPHASGRSAHTTPHATGRSPRARR
jgi:hypothetical protein